MVPRRIEHPNIELQIAPMIDVCFLLLFFYILTSKPIKPEGDLSMKLPGTVAQEEAVDIPDEQRIEIKANGQIVLNDQPMDGPTDAQLPTLLKTLTRFKEACEANKSQALVTLAPEDDAIHQRIADVMNVCAQAGIPGVTFTANSDSEEF
jgi:biopolymer transport protein ExbD